MKQWRRIVATRAGRMHGPCAVLINRVRVRARLQQLLDTHRLSSGHGVHESGPRRALRVVQRPECLGRMQRAARARVVLRELGGSAPIDARGGRIGARREELGDAREALGAGGGCGGRMQRADAMACVGRQLHVSPRLEEQSEQLRLGVRARDVQRAEPVLVNRVGVCMQFE